MNIWMRTFRHPKVGHTDMGELLYQTQPRVNTRYEHSGFWPVLIPRTFYLGLVCPNPSKDKSHDSMAIGSWSFGILISQMAKHILCFWPCLNTLYEYSNAVTLLIHVQKQNSNIAAFAHLAHMAIIWQPVIIPRFIIIWWILGFVWWPSQD